MFRLCHPLHTVPKHANVGVRLRRTPAAGYPRLLAALGPRLLAALDPRLLVALDPRLLLDAGCLAARTCRTLERASCCE